MFADILARRARPIDPAGKSVHVRAVAGIILDVNTPRFSGDRQLFGDVVHGGWNSVMVRVSHPLIRAGKCVDVIFLRPWHYAVKIRKICICRGEVGEKRCRRGGDRRILAVFKPNPNHMINRR